MSEYLLADSDKHLETPEGIELTMPLAEPVARGFAFAIDFIIRVIVVWVLSLSLIFLREVGVGIFLVLLFIIWWGYYVLFELLMDGASPGKRAMKLRVVHDDFTPITFSASLIRNLLRTADAMPGFYGFAAVFVLFNKDNKRLGDIAAKTIVVSTQQPRFHAVAISETALAPSVAFTADEQRSIIAFAQFSETHSEERAREIAQHVAVGLDEANVSRLVTQLRRYAKWFLGESR